MTAVGGTQGYNPETAASLSGGGFSNYWARPTYQIDPVKHYFSVATGVPASDLFNATGAGFPDVAAQAENFNIVVGGFTTFVAGTSCASPTFTGIVSLLNDQRLSAGKSTLGYLNPLFCACRVRACCLRVWLALTDLLAALAWGVTTHRQEPGHVHGYHGGQQPRLRKQRFHRRGGLGPGHGPGHT